MKEKSILLVDDEDIIRDSMSSDLRGANFQVSAASCGADAIELFKNDSFDLVVTDLMMEGMDGIQVLEQVKEIDPEIAVIILTGYGDMSSAITALRLGADDYLLKPCDFEELLLRMDQCFAKQDLTKKVKLYEDILPLCCVCKSIRDDAGKEPGQGEWLKVEDYLYAKTKVRSSHTYCPHCYDQFVENVANIKRDRK